MREEREWRRERERREEERKGEGRRRENKIKRKWGGEKIRERGENQNRKASSMMIKLFEETDDYKNDHNKVFF